MPSININEPENANMTDPSSAGGLVQHVMYLVRENRQVRDRRYKAMWDKFKRTYEGKYTGSDYTRAGERSKLVSPALASAIDGISATIEDAIFSRERWFDIKDDVMDERPQDMQQAHKVLEEDFEEAGVPDAIAKIVLNGSLYGTGIGKINVTRREIRKFDEQGEVQVEYRPLVTLEPIPPWEFVIDSQARDIKQAYFVAHETHVPRNVIWSRQKKGIYNKNVTLLGNTSSTETGTGGESKPDAQRKHEQYDGSVFVTEYYGLVPASLLKGHAKFTNEDVQGNGHVEVIVTIGNELELLRVIVNPFDMKDRPIVAYQHSYSPGDFWGRGVAEMGWNAQRALDAELRARMDALGLLTSPMLGADITRLPRNPDMQVRPGKVWLTRGRPSEVLEPILLGNIDPSTFNQSSEMERMVQVGTGGIESNAPLNVDRRNETASGISMIQSAALKRMRRTMWNIERQFLNPLIKKSAHRYMQFSKRRYPKDYQWAVKGTMGIVAREFEQASLIGLLSNIPPDSEQYNIILQSIIELSTSPKRDEILARIAESNKPDPKMQQMQEKMQQLEMKKAEEAVKEQMYENEKTLVEIEKIKAEIENIRKMTELEDEKVSIQAANTVIGHNKVKVSAQQNEIAREKNKLDAKAKAKAVKGPRK
jgi:hypothetical protein